MTMVQLPEKFYVARLRLYTRYPFLATAIFAMPVRVTDKLPTMAVDQYWRLYVNLDFIDKLSIESLEGIIYHEVLHLLRGHHDRAESIGVYNAGLVPGLNVNYPFVWNVAADCEINDDILEEGLSLLPNLKEMCLPENFELPRGLLAEEYYEKLKQQAEDQRDQLQQAIDQLGEGPASGQDGSGAGNTPGPWEDQQGPGSSLDQKDNTDGISPTQAEVIRQNTAEKAADQASKNPGSVPGGWERWAQARMKPKVDWKAALKAAVRQGVGLTSGMTDYYYDRPARRQSAFPEVILPRLRAPQPSVALIVDTSGSMSEENLSQALSEIGSVLKTVNGPVDVVSGDTQMAAVSKVLKPDQAKLMGGGGTDMGRMLEDLASLKKKYGLVVVITDGYTPWCKANPLTCPVLVVIVEERGPDGPAWAKTVRAHPDEGGMNLIQVGGESLSQVRAHPDAD